MALRSRRRALAFSAAVAVVLILAHELVAWASGGELAVAEFTKFLALGGGYRPLEMLGEMARRAGPALLLMALFGSFCTGGAERARGLLWLGAWVPLVALLALTGFVRVYDRFAFVSLPFLCLLASQWLHAAFRARRWPPRLLGAWVLCWFALGTGLQLCSYETGHGGRANWRGPLALVGLHRRPGDVLVFHGPILAKHYAGADLDVRQLDPGVALDGWLEPGRRVWLLMPQDAPLAYSAWLEEHPEPVACPEGSAGQLWVWVARRR